MNRRALLVMNIVLSGIILLLVLVIIRDFFSARTGQKPSMPSDIGSQMQKREVLRLRDFEIILKNNPFGFDGGTLTALGQGDTGKQTTTVSPSKYKLLGTIAASDKDSFAIFSADGKQELYKVNTDIPGLGTLARVEPYRVIIKGDREFEILLDEIKTKGGSPDADVTRPVPRQPFRQNASSPDEFIRQTGDGSYNLNAKMVQESIDNPQRLMTDARLVPIYKDGQQEGFKLSEVKQGGIYDSLGLQNGDVLMRINEYNITNPEAALQAFTALRGVERLQLDVMRNGAKVSLTYTIK